MSLFTHQHFSLHGVLLTNPPSPRARSCRRSQRPAGARSTAVRAGQAGTRQVPQAFWFPGGAGRAPSGSERRSCAERGVSSAHGAASAHSPGNRGQGKGSWETAPHFFGQQNDKLTTYVFDHRKKKYRLFKIFMAFCFLKKLQPADTESLFIFFLVLRD